MERNSEKYDKNIYDLTIISSKLFEFLLLPKSQLLQFGAASTLGLTGLD